MPSENENRNPVEFGVDPPPPICEWCEVLEAERDGLCASCSMVVSICDGCGARTEDYTLDVHDEVFCSSCARELEYCEECDQYFRETCLDDDECHRCSAVEVDDEGLDTEVHYYSFTPLLHFRKVEGQEVERKDDGRIKSAPLHLGLEIEVSLDDIDRESLRAQVTEPFGDWTLPVRREVARRSVVDGDQLVYLKSDSSIEGYGFEIVTHPFTWEWGREKFPFQYVDYLKDLGALDSPSTRETCGMHLHLDRHAFSRTHLLRFMAFHYANREWLGRLGGRGTRSHWATFHSIDLNDPRSRRTLVHRAKGPMWDGEVRNWEAEMANRRAESYRELLQDMRDEATRRGVTLRYSVEGNASITMTNWCSDRYDAINTSNSRTVELRYWSVPKSGEELRARLEFVHSLYHYTKTWTGKTVDILKTPEAFTWVRYTDWVSNGVADRYPAINQYLREEALVPLA